MTKLKSYIVLIVLAFNGYILSGQSQVDTTLLSINDTIHHFFVIKPKITISPTTFATNYSSYLSLGTGNTLSSVSEKVDSLRKRHVKYNHLLNGVLIENSKVIVHYDANDKLNHITGVIENKLGSISTTPVISSTTAINTAIASSTNTSFLWQDPENEASLKEQSGNPAATSYPTAKLLITKVNSKVYNVPSNYVLAYKVAVNYMDRSTLTYYINATTGAICKIEDQTRACSDHNVIDKNEQIDNCKNQGDKKETPLFPTASPNTVQSCGTNCVNNTANIYYYPSQYIFTQEFTYLGVCTHRLKEQCTNTWLYVTNGAQDFRDPSNVWANSNDVKGTTAFWSLSWANRFWATYFLRNSYNNNFGQITGRIGSTYVTQWDDSNNEIQIGKYGANWAVSLDILGHELTHGVTNNESQLGFDGESGAIDEGLSDIFGTMTEFWTTNYKNIGRSPNYEVGEDVSSTTGKRRSMSNPENFGCATTYGAGPNWKDPSDLNTDNGGKHYNCGVLDKWFYLVCEGGTGVNDLGHTYCVKGIGRDNASWIVYQTLCNYMTSTTNFNDLRFYTEYVAWQYYGYSPDFYAVTAAWYAVGLESTPTAINGQHVDLHNKTEVTNKSYSYNTNIQVFDYKTNASTIVDVASGDYIQFYGEDYPTAPAATHKDVIINSGSEFHAYITPGCTGGARMADISIHNSNDDDSEHEKMDKNNARINVFPNPNTGDFKVILDNDKELPQSIVIRDILGKEVKSIKNPTEYEYGFDMKSYNSGIYFINVFYSGKTISEKIIKN